MRMLHWCMLGFAILLLVTEVVISQLCKSVITLVDAFHTFFILMRLLLHPPPAPTSADSTAPPQASSSSPSLKPSPTLPLESFTTCNAQPSHEAPPQFESSHPLSPTISAPALHCRVSFADSRFQTVGYFLSSLILALLSIAYSLKILSFSLDPHPVHDLQLVVVVAALSLLYKVLVLNVNWGKLKKEWASVSRRPESVKCQYEVNHKVSAAEESRGPAMPGRVLDDISKVHPDADDSFCNGALVLCNPAASSIPEVDSDTPQPGVPPHAAALLHQSGSAGLMASQVHSDTTETSPDNHNMGHLESLVHMSSHPTESPTPSCQRPICLLSLFLVVQGLFSSLLSLIDSVVMLLINPQCLHGSSGACSLLTYLDPVLSLLAVSMLITTAMPQVTRYGLLLLQATPPHVCVSDLGERIGGVHGVQAVHDLHVWQLTESFTVASVHVQCHAWFPAHRCADLMSAVTEVLRSVGVSCCTVQPELALCSAGGAGSVPLVPPALQACSLACEKACSKKMCCNVLEEDTISTPAPPAGGTTAEPQTFVIENVNKT